MQDQANTEDCKISATEIDLYKKNNNKKEEKKLILRKYWS